VQREVAVVHVLRRHQLAGVRSFCLPAGQLLLGTHARTREPRPAGAWRSSRSHARHVWRCGSQRQIASAWETAGLWYRRSIDGASDEISGQVAAWLGLASERRARSDSDRGD
jgi:hypothetical protein